MSELTLPLPKPTRYFGHSLLSPMYTAEEMGEYGNACYRAAESDCERRIAEAVAQERERCASLADERYAEADEDADSDSDTVAIWLRSLAAAIRAEPKGE